MQPPPLHLETERLRLCVPGPEDAPRLLEYVTRNREHLRPWEPRRGPEYWTLTYWRRQLEAIGEEVRRGDGYRTVLVPRTAPDAPIIGVANLSQVARGAFQSAMLGYSIGRVHEGLGLMHEALEGLVAFAFDTLQLHRVQANHRPENVRSGRVLERLGFQREGVSRAYLFIDGAWRDHILTALVDPRGRPPS